MAFCPSCGTESEAEDEYCRNCGTNLGVAIPSRMTRDDSPSTDDTERDGWNWLNPNGPFRSPRTALNYFNAVGLVLILAGVGLVIAGVESPYAFVPEPFDMLVVLYMVAVVFVGLPVAGILLLTDNVLGFLRHG